MPQHNAPVMILLVDDQIIVGEMLRRMIVREPDLALHYCSDPNDAVEQALLLRPTVILQDLVMPGVDGLDIVRQLRARPETASTPIVVLSSKEDPATKSEAFAAGANDYLVKLPDRVELLARIRYHSNAYRMHLERDSAMAALRASQHRLLQANTELSETNEKLNQFVGMAAHDLRNPLGVILGFAKFLLRENQRTSFSEQQLRFLSSMQSSAEFMFRLVNNLLDVSKIEAGELHLEPAPTNLAALVTGNISLNRILAEEKEINISLAIDPAIPTLSIDADKIEQVLTNLVSNAIKFSQPGTSVGVSVQLVGNEVLLSVTDQGPGIPADELDKLFKAFGRTSVRATHGETSTGLGLVIAKKVVDGHGGRISVDSEVGRGSTFTVALPVTPASTSEAP